MSPCSSATWSASISEALRRSAWGSGPRGAKWLDIVRRAGGGPSARPVDHDGLAARVQLAVGLQFLQHPPRHLARAAHQPRQFLARHAQLGAVGMAHRLRLPGQVVQGAGDAVGDRSEEHTSELQSLMRISYAVFCLTKKKYKLQH